MRSLSGSILGLLLVWPLSACASIDDGPLRETLELALTQFDEAQRLQSDEPERARQLFRLAAQSFEAVAAAGIQNGRLEYNAGNAFLQAGDLGRGILHYRRAQRLIPRDPLLNENLAVARSRCLTSLPPSRGNQFLRGLFWWHFQTTTAGRMKFAIVMYILFWGLLAAAVVLRRRPLVIAAAVAALLSLTLGASLAVEQWMHRQAPAGVVLAMDVPVHRGPGENYQRQFEQPLQAGTEFVIRERRAGWWRIELPDGHGGWIAAGHADLVLPPNL